MVSPSKFTVTAYLLINFLFVLIDFYLSVDRHWLCRKLYFTKCVFRVQVRDREIKVNIFDMAGHPFFYEVSAEMFTHLTHSCWILCNVRALPSRGAVETVFFCLFCFVFLLHSLSDCRFSLFFFQVRNEFYKDSQGVLLVYDVGLRESFDALDSWLGEMKQEMGSQANMDSIVFVVCANKVKTPMWFITELIKTTLQKKIFRFFTALKHPVQAGGPDKEAGRGRG